jgi:hypothetical protein
MKTFPAKVEKIFRDALLRQLQHAHGYFHGQLNQGDSPWMTDEQRRAYQTALELVDVGLQQLPAWFEARDSGGDA